MNIRFFIIGFGAVHYLILNAVNSESRLAFQALKYDFQFYPRIVDGRCKRQIYLSFGILVKQISAVGVVCKQTLFAVLDVLAQIYLVAVIRGITLAVFFVESDYDALFGIYIRKHYA